MHLVEEEEDKPILGGLDLTPLAADILLAGLSEEEQLALTVKASIDIIREEQVARFIYVQLHVLGLLPSFVFYVSHYFLEYRHPNACIPMNFATWVLLRETSSVAGVVE